MWPKLSIITAWIFFCRSTPSSTHDGVRAHPRAEANGQADGWRFRSVEVWYVLPPPPPAAHVIWLPSFRSLSLSRSRILYHISSFFFVWPEHCKPFVDAYIFFRASKKSTSFFPSPFFHSQLPATAEHPQRGNHVVGHRSQRHGDSGAGSGPRRQADAAAASGIPEGVCVPSHQKLSGCELITSEETMISCQKKIMPLPSLCLFMFRWLLPLASIQWKKKECFIGCTCTWKPYCASYTGRKATPSRLWTPGLQPLYRRRWTPNASRWSALYLSMTIHNSHQSSEWMEIGKAQAKKNYLVFCQSSN